MLLLNPVFAAKLGQMEMQLEAMLSVCKTAGREYDRLLAGPDPAGELLKLGSLKSAVVAKMLCGQLGWNIASVGSEMFGGLGFTEESLIGKLLRDVRYVSLVKGGTTCCGTFCSSATWASCSSRQFQSLSPATCRPPWSPGTYRSSPDRAHDPSRTA